MIRRAEILPPQVVFMDFPPVAVNVCEQQPAIFLIAENRERVLHFLRKSDKILPRVNGVNH